MHRPGGGPRRLSVAGRNGGTKGEPQTSVGTAVESAAGTPGDWHTRQRLESHYRRQQECEGEWPGCRVLLRPGGPEDATSYTVGRRVAGHHCERWGHGDGAEGMRRPYRKANNAKTEGLVVRKEVTCDGSLRPDPHNSIACADSATNDLETNGDTYALVGWLQQPRELPRVKGGVSLMPEKEVVSWSRNIPELLAKEDRTEQEDEEPGITESVVRTSVTTGQSGAEAPQRRTEDRWPRGAYS
ncbi:hypothetical protein NDU88_002048 [Pleurodeles waltl]|uniref:Uncharacterized protein n=1 Tax=Pleurodeles waltl TaxID=8319 RepID=A0AAV7T0X5_PLEWA|nr:hypothetical protein NDU88_002048 [Pleurodeles waltl]